MGFAAAPVARTQAGTGQAGAVAFLLGAALSLGGCRPPAKAAAGPQFAGADGQPTRLERARGFTVLVFWSQQSPPSMAMLAEVSRLSSGADTARARYAAVSVDGPAARLPVGLSDRLSGWTDPGRAAASSLMVEVLPTVVVFDSAARVVARVSGAGPTAVEELEEALASLH